MEFCAHNHGQGKVDDGKGLFYAQNETGFSEYPGDWGDPAHAKHPGNETEGNKAVMTLATLSAQHMPNSQPAILDTALPVSEYINITPIMMVDTTANITATWPLRLLATAHMGASQGIAASVIKGKQRNKTPVSN